MKPKVVVAEEIAPAGVKALAEYCTVDVAVGLSRAELIERLADAAGLIVRSGTQVNAELLGSAQHLRVIGRAGVGVDNIDLEAATTAGVLVVNAPTANVISAAEHTMALMLAQARNVPRGDTTLRSGLWDRSALEGVELHGKTLGLIGLGRVGSLVAVRALAFGMNVVAYDPYVGEEAARRVGARLAEELEEVLSEADIITIHVPLTRETRNLIGHAETSKMKDGVRIVNASRGGVLDESALVDALASGKVAGAALDVFEEEPKPHDGLKEFAQVVLTPHLGASTREAQDKAGTDVAIAVADTLRGELVSSAVNVDVGQELPDEVRRVLPLAERLGIVFVALARGLPAELVVRAEGELAAHPTRAIGLAALTGALRRVVDAPVSYVNAPTLARIRGLVLSEEASPEVEEYLWRVKLTGSVGKRVVSVAGTMGRKGPLLVEILGYEVELPLSEHMLIVRNDDVPGVIGRLGTFIGDAGINIANMVVGRAPETGAAAMMGLNLDQPLQLDQVEGLLGLEGISEAIAVEL
ncbi:MAG: phosphoglycerate dehydrogenase [Acidimicrobiia bacterium]